MKKEYYLIISTILVSTSLNATNLVNNDLDLDRAIALSLKNEPTKEDEELNLAIAISQSEEEERQHALTVSVVTTEDKELQLAIALSMQDLKPKNAPIIITNNKSSKEDELKQIVAKAINNLLRDDQDDLEKAIALSLEIITNKHINEMSDVYVKVGKEYKEDLIQLERTFYPKKSDQRLDELDSIDVLQDENPMRAAQVKSRLEEVERRAREPKYGIHSPSDEVHLIARFMREYGYGKAIAKAAYDKFVNGGL